MEKGEDGATAVASFNAMIQARVNGAFTPQQDLPPILSGGGAPPSQQQKVQELDTKSTRNLVAGILSQTAQANQ